MNESNNYIKDFIKKIDRFHIITYPYRTLRKIKDSYISSLWEKDRTKINFFRRKKFNKYLRGLDYIVSMMFIAKCCNGFITSQTSGAVGVMCFTEGFEYFYVFDLGTY